MLELRGATALSTFRRQRLLTQIQTQLPFVTAVNAEFIHLADTKSDLTDDQLEVLAKILTYGPSLVFLLAGDGPCCAALVTRNCLAETCNAAQLLSQGVWCV